MKRCNCCPYKSICNANRVEVCTGKRYTPIPDPKFTVGQLVYYAWFDSELSRWRVQSGRITKIDDENFSINNGVNISYVKYGQVYKTPEVCADYCAIKNR